LQKTKSKRCRREMRQSRLFALLGRFSTPRAPPVAAPFGMRRSKISPHLKQAVLAGVEIFATIVHS
jgi:hypothetical protein